jgi:CRP-like cAMP-binding protein
MSNNLENSINKIFSLTQPSLLLLTNEMSFHKYNKEDIIVKSGRLNTHEYIILDGICRSFVNSPEGDEITLSFYTSGSPVSPNITRVNRDGFSTVNIQALTNIEIAYFSSSKLMDFMRINREISEWGNRVLQNELFQKVEKELAQASMSAKDRLNHFRERFPRLENLIPHSYIASYLGITNVSLSRIRSNIPKK